MSVMRTSILRAKIRPAFAVALVLALAIGAIAQDRDRSKIPERYKWNLADIYPSDTAWRPGEDKGAPRPPPVRAAQGKAGPPAPRPSRPPLQMDPPAQEQRRSHGRPH